MSDEQRVTWGSKGRAYITEKDGIATWDDPAMPDGPPVRGYVTALKVDSGEMWATLSNGETIHRREVDGVWEDVE